MKTYIVHFGELGLKGRNRAHFARQLARNIRRALRDLGEVKARRFHSHLMVESAASSTEDVEARLSRVFGIAYFAPVAIVPRPDDGQDAEVMDAIVETALHLAEGIITPETTFRIRTSRGDKRFPLISPEVDREVGAHVVRVTGAPVQLKEPDVTLSIQIYRDAAYLFVQRLPGPGGLPVGVSGRVLTLFSGGIDSPVAAHMMLKRGCTTDFLHFHLLPSAEQARNSKIVALARDVLAPHRRKGRLYLVSSAPFEAAMVGVETRVATVVFRRFIMRAAERIAARRRALALVTGESVGQVASQTLENLSLISQATALPILRPLVGMDKAEIIELAKEVGTYERSIEPYKDPCSLHARNPATRARVEEVRRVEALIDVEALLEQTLDNHVEKVPIRFKS